MSSVLFLHQFKFGKQILVGFDGMELAGACLVSQPKRASNGLGSDETLFLRRCEDFVQVTVFIPTEIWIQFSLQSRLRFAGVIDFILTKTVEVIILEGFNDFLIRFHW